MANFVKWWKCPLFWKIFSTAIITMTITLLCVLFIPEPFGLITSLPVIFSGGFLIRRFIIKQLENAKYNK